MVQLSVTSELHQRLLTVQDAGYSCSSVAPVLGTGVCRFGGSIRKGLEGWLSRRCHYHLVVYITQPELSRLGKREGRACHRYSPTAPLPTRRSRLNFDLSEVDNARDLGNTTAACNEVAQYYADASTAGWLRKAAPHPGTARVGGSVDAVMLNDTYDFYGEIGRVPRNKDGGLDWHDYGPVGDDEFCYALNRHFVWPGFNSAWMQTGNPEYAAAFNSQVQDWTFHNLPGPSAVSSGNTTWRTIEAGIRSGGSWPTSFFGFQNTDEFKGSTRCAMVAGMAEHGRYLHAFGDAGNSNWRSMQCVSTFHTI